jgi:hypothetical protein
MSEMVIVKSVYKGQSRETEKCLLYTGLNYIHYSLRGKMRLPFIDSDLLYRGALCNFLKGLFMGNSF